MKSVTVKLSRDEALAVVISLERVKKPYGWQTQALQKFLKAMKLAPLP